MIEKTCRCGKNKKNFRMDIGPFYVEDCCLKAGYDHLGNLKESASASKEEPVQQSQVAAEEDKAQKQLEKDRKKAERAAKKAAEKLAKESKKQE